MRLRIGTAQRPEVEARSLIKRSCWHRTPSVRGTVPATNSLCCSHSRATEERPSYGMSVLFNLAVELFISECLVSLRSSTCCRGVGL
jgi:hypothetical protein